jgi:hypothetical protein
MAGQRNGAASDYYCVVNFTSRSATTSLFLVPQQRNIINRGFFAHVTIIAVIKSCADYILNRIRSSMMVGKKSIQ